MNDQAACAARYDQMAAEIRDIALRLERECNWCGEDTIARVLETAIYLLTPPQPGEWAAWKQEASRRLRALAKDVCGDDSGHTWELLPDGSEVLRGEL